MPVKINNTIILTDDDLKPSFEHFDSLPLKNGRINISDFNITTEEIIRAANVAYIDKGDNFHYLKVKRVREFRNNNKHLF